MTHVEGVKNARNYITITSSIEIVQWPLSAAAAAEGIEINIESDFRGRLFPISARNNSRTTQNATRCRRVVSDPMSTQRTT